MHCLQCFCNVYIASALCLVSSPIVHDALQLVNDFGEYRLMLQENLTRPFAKNGNDTDSDTLTLYEQRQCQHQTVYVSQHACLLSMSSCTDVPIRGGD